MLGNIKPSSDQPNEERIVPLIQFIYGSHGTFQIFNKARTSLGLRGKVELLGVFIVDSAKLFLEAIFRFDIHT